MDILFWITISLIRFFLSFLSSGSKFMTISSASCSYLHLLSSRSRSLCLGCRWVFVGVCILWLLCPTSSSLKARPKRRNWTEMSVQLSCTDSTIQTNWTELNWTDLNWTELNWTDLNWTELNWTGLQYVDAVLLISFQFISRSSVQFSLFH